MLGVGEFAASAEEKVTVIGLVDPMSTAPGKGETETTERVGEDLVVTLVEVVELL